MLIIMRLLCFLIDLFLFSFKVKKCFSHELFEPESLIAYSKNRVHRGEARHLEREGQTKHI